MWSDYEIFQDQFTHIFPSCSWAQSKISMITGIDYFVAQAQVGRVKVFKKENSKSEKEQELIF